MATSGLPGPIESAYQLTLQSGVLTPDPAQAEAVDLLDRLGRELIADQSRPGILRTLGRGAHKIKGAYLWGAVGRGKTALMDLFFDAIPIAAKRRIHFHAFMDEVHQAIAAFRAENSNRKGRRDPVAHAARPYAQSLRLLCLDEFHVHDITNAMLLDRLFSELFDNGVVLVATSNVAPDGLYENGLNRQLVLPFIARLKAQCQVFELKAAMDYRREKLLGQKVYHFGKGIAARRAMDALWHRLVGAQAGHAGFVSSLGRQIAVPAQAMGVARFGFAQLCEAPLGARDYLRIAQSFHTILIDDVPQFGGENSNAAKRFILLIDTFYDRGVKLGASFAAALEQLGQDDKTAFEFLRAVSRLVEMQSEDYLTAPRSDHISR